MKVGRPVANALPRLKELWKLKPSEIDISNLCQIAKGEAIGDYEDNIEADWEQGDENELVLEDNSVEEQEEQFGLAITSEEESGQKRKQLPSSVSNNNKRQKM